MKKTPSVGLIVFGLLVLLALNFFYSSPSVIANEPTPTLTPTAPSPQESVDELRCRIASNENCDIFDKLTHRPIGVDDPALSLQLYPLPNSSGVPTYTLVSVSFPIPIEQDSLTRNTFYLTQGNQRIEGTVDYINNSRMAVFRPSAPLLKDITYTARATRGIRYISGLPLEQDLLWNFTTTTGEPLFANEPSIAAIPSYGNMYIYFGDLHSHTTYSDGWGSPLEAYNTTRARGLDFFGLSEHGFMLTQQEWESLQEIADSVTVNGQFIGLRGFEYTGYKGHLNVFNTNTFVHRNNAQYDTQAEFYNWLLTQPNVIAQFNHPSQTNPPDFNFNDFAYNPLVDHKIVLQELTSPTEYFRSLDNGWHLGSVGNSDAHVKDWGARRLGIVAPNLTRSSVYEALAARRTFFASPNYVGLAVVMRANGYWMGSAVPNSSQLNFNIHVHDPTPGGRSLRIKLYENGVLKKQTSISSRTSYYWSPTLAAKLGSYYYVEAYYDNWQYAAYTSPIWVERFPVAKAGPSQVVPTGQTVTLNGSASTDPDGDALAYNWTQNSGPTVSLSSKTANKPTFKAPNSAATLTFQLAVADPGGLTDNDTATIQVSNQPILHISKTGPAKANTGELITYLLTVVNKGVTAATNVRVTDKVPGGATYISGGDSIANGVVSWNVPNIPANGGTAQVSFSVKANGSIINKDYQASCSNCINATGTVPVITNGQQTYLPLLNRGR
ncbi:MAG: CehA/McbA family metallohydrolase [Anaerolineae bacterium]|nr:CehA/McbA family metallohydrolase [Anaerolineae bacterium]